MKDSESKSGLKRQSVFKPREPNQNARGGGEGERVRASGGDTRRRAPASASPGRLHLELVALARVSLEHRRSQVLLSHLAVPRAHEHVHAVHLILFVFVCRLACWGQPMVFYRVMRVSACTSFIRGDRLLSDLSTTDARLRPDIALSPVCSSAGGRPASRN